MLLIPGTVAGLILRLRTFDALAVAPLLSISLIGVGAIGASLLGVAWGPLTFAGGTALLWAVAWILRVLMGSRARRRGITDESRTGSAPSAPPDRPEDRTPSRWRRSRSAAAGRDLYFIAGFVVAAAVIAVLLSRVFGSPDNFSQTFDNVFHLNAVRWVLNTGDASSLTIISMTAAGQPPYFYPAAWHGFVALVIELSGAPLTVGVTSANLVIAAVIWPLSCLFLVRQLWSLSRPAIVGAGVLVSGFSAFPILLLDFGVLYPNVLAFAMVPAALALVAAAVGQAPRSPLPKRIAAVLCAFALPGIAISHPNGALTLIALALPLVVAVYATLMAAAFRSRTWYLLGVWTGALALVTYALSRIWITIRPPEAAAFWDRVETSSQALGEALLNAPFGRPAAWTVSVLAIVGLVSCARDRRTLWFVGSFAVSTAVFIVAAGFEISDLRSFVTGGWYNDPYRLAAIAPLVAAPLSVIGLDTAIRWAVARADALARGRVELLKHRPVAIAASTLLVLLVLVPAVLDTRSMRVAVDSARVSYEVTPESALVSTDELELIGQLDDLVPEQATIAVNPWTGAGLAFALANRDTTYKHVLSNSSPDDVLIDQSLKDFESVPGVCDAISRSDVDFVLDFGLKEVHGGSHRYPGIEDISTDPDFELVAQEGEARLYEFTGC